MDKYIKFAYIINQINESPINNVKLKTGGHHLHGGICLKTKRLPVSINEPEFNYMKDFIIKHNLRNGVELATGTGISTLAIGLGMKETEGSLMSMDSYVEEMTQNMPMGESNVKPYFNSDCYKAASKIVELYDLKGVSLKIGLSPHNLKQEIENLPSQVDFVFLDCPKTDQDYERDIKVIYPYLYKRFAIFVHDTHVFGEHADKVNMMLFGKTFTKIYKYYEGTKHEIVKQWPLALITNLE